MKKNNLCPYVALMVILGQENDVEQLLLDTLKKYDISRSIISTAQGTATSALADYFGLGDTAKTIVSTFVERDKVREIMTDIKQTLQNSKKANGLMFTLPLTALSSNILGLWRNKDERESKETNQI